MIRIKAPGVRDWTPKQSGKWYSPYTLDQYTQAQKGAKAHPLQATIERALDISSGESHQLNLINAPSGCAPDVAAFCAGEPDAMLDCEFSKAQRGPVRVYVDISSELSISAQDVAEHVAKIAQAVYSVGLARPVTVKFYVCGRASKKHADALISLPEINSYDCIDAGLLALVADTRTAREMMLDLVPDMQKTGAVKWPENEPVFSDGVKIDALKSAKDSPSIEKLITLINGD